MQASARKTQQRLASLDVFRGAAVAMMLIILNPGDPAHVYWPFNPAQWNGWTPADLLYPFFIFIMGAAISIRLSEHPDNSDMPRGVSIRRYVRRVVLLVLLGLLLNGFPSFNIYTIRVTGVLQRIALVYAIVVPLTLLFKPVLRFVFAALILAGYWAVLALAPVDGAEPSIEASRNLARLIDFAVIGESHLHAGLPTDPQGLLGTIPALVTCLMGSWAGAFIRDHQRSAATAARLGIAGLLLTMVGFVAGEFMPINRSLWTPSFVLLTGGLAMAFLSVCFWWVDVRRFRGKTRPFELMGLNAIVIFVGSGLMSRAVPMIHIGKGSGTPRLSEWMLEILTRFGAPENAASLGMAGVFVVFWWAVAWAMAKRKWIVRL